MITAERKPMEELLDYVKPYNSISAGGLQRMCYRLRGRRPQGSRPAILRPPNGVYEGRQDTEHQGNHIGAPVRPRNTWRSCFPTSTAWMRSCPWPAVAAYRKSPGGLKTNRVFPAVNTKFMGASERQGVWAERCQGCGDCILGLTGGICPVARCSKRLFNGPCGGSTNGKCEIDSNVDCAWQLIWDRLKALGLEKRYEEIMPAKDWRSSRDGGPRKIIREDLFV